jgi:hypothetical protein
MGNVYYLGTSFISNSIDCTFFMCLITKNSITLQPIYGQSQINGGRIVTVTFGLNSVRNVVPINGKIYSSEIKTCNIDLWMMKFQFLKLAKYYTNKRNFHYFIKLIA